MQELEDLGVKMKEYLTSLDLALPQADSNVTTHMYSVAGRIAAFENRLGSVESNPIGIPAGSSQNGDVGKTIETFFVEVKKLVQF